MFFLSSPCIPLSQWPTTKKLKDSLTLVRSKELLDLQKNFFVSKPSNKTSIGFSILPLLITLLVLESLSSKVLLIKLALECLEETK